MKGTIRDEVTDTKDQLQLFGNVHLQLTFSVQRARKLRARREDVIMGTSLSTHTYLFPHVKADQRNFQDLILTQIIDKETSLSSLPSASMRLSDVGLCIRRCTSPTAIVTKGTERIYPISQACTQFTFREPQKDDQFKRLLQPQRLHAPE